MLEVSRTGWGNIKYDRLIIAYQRFRVDVMRLVVFNVDQKGSRKAVDAVPAALSTVNDARAPWELALRAERTVGDEWQVAFSHAASAVSLLCWVLESKAWHVGVGLGEVEEPLPSSTREARGSAYLAAREAADLAKRSPYSLAIRSEGGSVELSQALAWSLAAIVSSRSPEGMEAARLRSAGMTGVDIARQLGISPQAVSTRLKVADWVVGEAVKEQLAQVFAQPFAP